MTDENLEKSTGKENSKRQSTVAWVLTVIICTALISVLFWQPEVARSMDNQAQASAPTSVDGSTSPVETTLQNIPVFQVSSTQEALVRQPNPHTGIDTSLRTTAIEYTVQEGDSVFGIAQKFNIAPETVLWSNYDVLRDNPHKLAIGQVLKIPPTDGIWYKWTSRDTLDTVAAKFSVTPEDILLYVGNDLDLSNPIIEPGTYVMIPGGEREYQQWLIPDIPRGAAGVSTSPYFQCETSANSFPGTGYFVWPTSVHTISGNNYWSGHLAIDIGAGIGSPVYAADSGVVVWAGWMENGYGNVVIIDHNNGYVTVYAHLSVVNVSCGQNIFQGSVLGSAGSTGNSTGPHLHFEIRYMGGFINPQSLLP
ncbi:MAG TPA: M23 family metallopeptidase [Anaerolineaceae bacterium]|nr:M23 family metallopeptidase [Anaerolineaceae bacterium]HUM48960.1 M23 family metallopeptidase [Anaerolineaceae bacterium]